MSKDLVRAALLAARDFINNGVEFGYIRMPDVPTDAAHDTLPKIETALAALSAPFSPNSTSRNGRRVEVMEKRFDVVLDANAPDFAERFAEAIGAKEGDVIEIATPQFTRADGLQVPRPQVSFNNLPFYDDATLKAIGCQRWDEPNADGETLWLFPAEWYSIIPNGTPIVDINGEHELFERGKTDDDMRFGALAYGFLKKEPRP